MLRYSKQRLPLHPDRPVGMWREALLLSGSPDAVELWWGSPAIVTTPVRRAEAGCLSLNSTACRRKKCYGDMALLLWLKHRGIRAVL